MSRRKDLTILMYTERKTVTVGDVVLEDPSPLKCRSSTSNKSPLLATTKDVETVSLNVLRGLVRPTDKCTGRETKVL